jgi:uncharacterized protein (DUF433 family)
VELLDMTVAANGHSAIVRTERGLSIAGTRITLYSILEYLHADWPPKLIQDWLDLTDAQIADALDYISAHRDEVEQEYHMVVARAEELRHYWDSQAQQHLAQRRSVAISPDQTALREQFEAWKAHRKVS